MNRKLIAIVLGSLIAAPALANNEIDAGSLPQPVATTKSFEQVRAELVSAQNAGDVIVNAELGTTAKQTTQGASRTRADLRAEVLDAQRSGELLVNGELGSIQL